MSTQGKDTKYQLNLSDKDMARISSNDAHHPLIQAIYSQGYMLSDISNQIGLTERFWDMYISDVYSPEQKIRIFPKPDILLDICDILSLHPAHLMDHGTRQASAPNLVKTLIKMVYDNTTKSDDRLLAQKALDSEHDKLRCFIAAPQNSHLKILFDRIEEFSEERRNELPETIEAFSKYYFPILGPNAKKSKREFLNTLKESFNCGQSTFYAYIDSQRHALDAQDQNIGERHDTFARTIADYEVKICTSLAEFYKDDPYDVIAKITDFCNESALPSKDTKKDLLCRLKFTPQEFGTPHATTNFTSAENTQIFDDLCENFTKMIILIDVIKCDHDALQGQKDQLDLDALKANDKGHARLRGFLESKFLLENSGLMRYEKITEHKLIAHQPSSSSNEYKL